MSIKKTSKILTVQETLNIEVLSFNTNYFDNEREFLSIHGLMLTNFVDSDLEDYLDFLKDSIKNDYYLNDMIKEINFNVSENEEDIIFKEDDEEFSYQNMGEYILDEYRIFVSGSYSFIRCMNTQKTFMYYGD
ncbi:MAG: hypothetical protein QM490_01880 [Candidatus Gracilibacteria bacterium]